MTKISKERLRGLNLGVETWVYIAIALTFGFLTPRFTRGMFEGWFSPVDKSTMTSILSAVASGMITLTGIVFSLVFVLLQFGSATYSPRISRIFAHSYVLRNALGIFTGTFLYSLMAMRTIGMEEADQVNSFPIWIVTVWLLGSIAILARLIRVFATLTITNILTALGRVGQLSIKRVYKPYIKSPKPTVGSGSLIDREGDTVQRIMYEGGPVYVNEYKWKILLSLAHKTDTVIYLPYFVGDALKNGSTLAFVQGKSRFVDESRIYSSIKLGVERAFLYDPKYAFRLLVDTAIRALSPAINDPTTAVQVLDHIESLLRYLGNSDLEIGNVRDSNGVLRLVFKTPSWEDYLQLGLSEIMLYGAGSIQVERRMKALLLFLRGAVPPERAKAVSRFLEQRESLVSVSFKNTMFRDWANIPDREGIGSGADGKDVLLNET